MALLFFWNELERQVRVRGVAAKVSREQSRTYFESRPRGSQIGASVSPQSAVIAGRETLLGQMASFGHEPIAVPDHWGGYRVAPFEFEFWQGRPDRLHDRLRYRLVDGGWIRERLAP